MVVNRKARGVAITRGWSRLERHLKDIVGLNIFLNDNFLMRTVRAFLPCRRVARFRRGAVPTYWP